MLDVACGAGRHAIPAARHGAHVLAVDADPERIKQGQQSAQNLPIEWVHANLDEHPLPPESFDLVMIFNYLDRRRMPDFKRAVRPGGYLLCETFLESQRDYGWGPMSDNHLLKPGELWRLVEPFEIVLAREALEFVGGRPSAVASVLAVRND